MTRSPGLGFVAGAGAALLIGAWQAEANDAVARTTYTFTAVPFGSAGAKTIMVAFGGRQSPANQLVSATVDGNPATIVGQTTNANLNNSGFFYVSGIIATSGTITLTFASAKARCGISVWSFTGDFSVLGSAFVDTYVATSVNEAVGGLVMACSYSGSNASYVWTNVVENTDMQFGSNTLSSASDAPSATAAVSISAAITNPATPTLAIVSLVPA